MASNEAYIESLLPLQQETIARAALAGVRWERYEIKDWQWEPDRDADKPFRMLSFMRTKFSGYLPDGTNFGEFDDPYEAAVVGLSIVEGAAGQDAGGDVEGFDLLPGNEQPAPTGRRASGIDFTALKAKRLP